MMTIEANESFRLNFLTFILYFISLAQINLIEMKNILIFSICNSRQQEASISSYNKIDRPMQVCIFYIEPFVSFEKFDAT